jgi:opacity protein-like surface antigen
MIRKFATVPPSRVVLVLMLATILAGAITVHAQQTPAEQPAAQTPAQPAPAQQPSSQKPADQQSSSQEASTEEIGPTHKVKPHDYKNWVFNVGGGGSLTNGTTTKFARGGGLVGAAGVARNYGKYFGLRFDFQWDNLPLRNSALGLAQAPGATSHVYSFLLDPIINIPVSKAWSGYAVFGPGFFIRSGKLDSSSVVPGTACNSFWNWWGTCFNGSVPLNREYLSTHLNQFGLNFGGGVARKITPKIELYGEFRYLHGTADGRTTDLRPITVGLRW